MQCKESASLITVVERSLCILFSYLVQICFFGHLPSLIDIAGSVVIAVTVLLIGVREVVDEKANDSSTARTVFCLGRRATDQSEEGLLAAKESTP